DTSQVPLNAPSSAGLGLGRDVYPSSRNHAAVRSSQYLRYLRYLRFSVGVGVRLAMQLAMKLALTGGSTTLGQIAGSRALAIHRDARCKTANLEGGLRRSPVHVQVHTSYRDSLRPHGRILHCRGHSLAGHSHRHLERSLHPCRHSLRRALGSHERSLHPCGRSLHRGRSLHTPAVIAAVAVSVAFVLSVII